MLARIDQHPFILVDLGGCPPYPENTATLLALAAAAGLNMAAWSKVSPTEQLPVCIEKDFSVGLGGQLALGVCFGVGAGQVHGLSSGFLSSCLCFQLY